MKTASNRYKSQAFNVDDAEPALAKKYRKAMIVFFVGIMVITFLLGIFYSGRPEMLFFCTISLSLVVVAMFFNAEILNSLVVAIAPLYIIVFILSLIYINWWAFLIHSVIFIFSIYLTIVRWKNSSPLIIVVASFFYIAFIISTLAIPLFASDVYYKSINVLILALYMVGVFSIALFIHLWKSRQVTKKHLARGKH